jgi:hypothetical protein
MKDKIKEICNKLNREQLSVHGATEELLVLFSVSQQREMLPNKYDVYSEIKRLTELYYNEDNVRKSAFGLGFSTGVSFVNKEILK